VQETVHLVGSTPLLAGSKLTVAVIVELACACTEPGLAVKETWIAWNVIPMFPLCLAALMDVAAIMRFRLFAGGLAGAL